jgi:hypothetical protein
LAARATTSTPTCISRGNGSTNNVIAAGLDALVARAGKYVAKVAEQQQAELTLCQIPDPFGSVIERQAIDRFQMAAPSARGGSFGSN